MTPIKTWQCCNNNTIFNNIIVSHTQTRYPNLSFHRIRPGTITHLYDIGGSSSNSPALRPGSIKVKRTAEAAGITPTQNSTAKTSPLVISTTSQEKENLPQSKRAKEESLLSTPKRKALADKSSISLAYYAEPEGECVGGGLLLLITI